MAYRINDHEFNTVDEYNAAKRDLEKINGLQRVGRSTAETAKNYKKQIRDNNITFETVIGSDYLESLDRQTFTEHPKPREEKIEITYVESGKRKFLKRMLITPLAVVFFLALLLIILWIYEGDTSENKIRELRSMSDTAGNTDTAGTAVNTAADSTGTEDVTDAAAAGMDPSNTQDDSTMPGDAKAYDRPLLPRFKALAERNPDIAGWLVIPGTKIDYPVMYLADDNDFYLEHDFDKAPDANGLLVMDKRCDPDSDEINWLIHGHNMKSGAMFGSLRKYTSEKYFIEHPDIEFSTLYEQKTYQIFAVFRSSVYDETTDDFRFYDYILIEDEADYDAYVKGVKEQSLYDTGITPSYGDPLITLSTCDYTKENGRLVLVGRALQE